MSKMVQLGGFFFLFSCLAVPGIILEKKQVKKSKKVKGDRRRTMTEKSDIIKVIRTIENRWILSKETTRKITSQEGRLLNFLRSLMLAGLSLTKNFLMSLGRSILIPSGSKTLIPSGAAISKKNFGSGMTAISIEEMKSIMKIVISLEESGLLIKGVRETNKNDAKEQKDGFAGMLLEILAASISGNMLVGNPKVPGWGLRRDGEGVTRAGEGEIALSQGSEGTILGRGTIRADQDF